MIKVPSEQNLNQCLQIIPSIDTELSEFWFGPLEVISEVSAVNYRVIDVDGNNT